MKVWEIGPRGGIESLRSAERDTPEPGKGEIRVKLVAAGLNYRDLMVLRGEYGNDLPETRIPLSDGVGVIEALGDGVSGLAIGDRVIAPNFLEWRETPGYG